MKKTLRIARLELNSLFYSPIAWFLTAVFLFQCGLSFISALERLMTYQQLGGRVLSFLNFSTISVFGIQGGLLGDVLRKVYLYMPLLTMGLISRELSSGTIRLLYSSPLTVPQIVYGKFLAMMAYNFILTLVLIVFAIVAMANIHMADAGFLFPGIVAVYLLLCAYAAIGLFMSSLTAYQVVAAISTIVIFAVLAYIGSVGQGIDFIRDITYFLSISGRAEKLCYGLFSSKHIIYFIVIIGMFLAFTIIKLRSTRESVSGTKLVMRYGGVVAVALMISYISSRPGLIAYYDATRSHTQTITPGSQEIIKALGEEPLKVTSYINLLDWQFNVGKPDQRNQDADRWERYMRFKPNIDMNYVYYYDAPGDEQQLFEQYPGKSLQQIAEQQAFSYNTDMSLFKTPQEIKKIIDLKAENNRYVMHLQWRDKSTFLRTFDDNERFPSEQEVAAALKRMIEKPSLIVFAQGNGERDYQKKGDAAYGMMLTQKGNRISLVNQGFETKAVNIAQEQIPDSCDALVVADPAAYSAPAIKRLQEYISGGGNLLLMLEPGKSTVVQPLLDTLGIVFAPGHLLQQSKENSPELVTGFFTAEAAAIYEGFEKERKDSTGVTMNGVAAMHALSSSFTFSPLLNASAAITQSSESDSTHTRSTALAASLIRQRGAKQQRIIVSGDADFLSNMEMKRFTAANMSLVTPLFGSFTNGRFPVNTERPSSADNRLTITPQGLKTEKTVFLGILPGLIALGGSIFLLRRRKK